MNRCFGALVIVALVVLAVVGVQHVVETWRFDAAKNALAGRISEASSAVSASRDGVTKIKKLIDLLGQCQAVGNKAR